jgi:hypothetical protein
MISQEQLVSKTASFNMIAETATAAVRAKAAGQGVSVKSGIWLPFLNTYRTMCNAPEPSFKCTLEGIRKFKSAA